MRLGKRTNDVQFGDHYRTPTGRGSSVSPYIVIAESTAKLVRQHQIKRQLAENKVAKKRRTTKVKQIKSTQFNWQPGAGIRATDEQIKNFFHDKRRTLNYWSIRPTWQKGVGIVAGKNDIKNFFRARHQLLIRLLAIKIQNLLLNWRALSYGLATAGIVGGLFVGYSYLSISTGYQLNLAQAQSGQMIAKLPDQADEATDESTISDQQIADHQVQVDYLKTIEIPTLKIKARVMPMGLNPDKTIQAPTNINDAGWYTGSAKVGVKNGSQASFIDGHDIGRIGEGIFYNLKDAKQGDEIIIEKGDGSKLTYRVVKTEIVALDDIDMNKVLTSADASKPGLNLMTCDGAVIKQDGKVTQSHRLVVYSVLE